MEGHEEETGTSRSSTAGGERPRGGRARHGSTRTAALAREVAVGWGGCGVAEAAGGSKMAPGLWVNRHGAEGACRQGMGTTALAAGTGKRSMEGDEAVR